MGSDDRYSAVYAPFDAIKSHYGYLYRIKDIGEALQLAPKVIRCKWRLDNPIIRIGLVWENTSE